MLNQEFSSQFKRDFKKAKARGKSIDLLTQAMRLLVSGFVLPPVYRDHQLKGKWKDFRELHVESDWLLVYRIAGNTVYFTRTGTHSDIFDE